MTRNRSVLSGIWFLGAWCLAVTTFAGDVFAQDASNKDASNKDASNKDASNKDASNKDASNKDASNKDASNKDASNKDASNKDGESVEAHPYDGRANEGWLMNGVFAIGTGLQGGDPGTGSVAWARARTRILAGVDLRSDEARSNGIGFYGFAEIERRASFGAEVRYQRWWTSTIAFHAAILGTIVPESMIGGGVGARFGFPIANKLTLFLEPGFAVFPFGSDLPGNNIILWGTLIGGVGVAL